MGRSLVGLELPEIQQLLGEGEASYRARQIYQAIYSKRVTLLDAMTNLPREMRERLAARYTFALPKVENYFDSQDGTRRYLLELEDGRSIETVLMPEQERDT